MQYYSSRDRSWTVSPSTAVTQGLAPDGGLYIPEEFPAFPVDKLTEMTDAEIETWILRSYFTDMDPGALSDIVEKAYKGFENGDIAPVTKAGGVYFAELWHGRTSAFKDVALSVLPYLLTEARKNIGADKEICLLTATSGDTGSAALAGFSDVPGTRIMVFYPYGGTSLIQKKQMTTCAGKNTKVCAVRGNFDDAQSAVKTVFLRDDIPENISLSSANSINIGRLVPQIAYYFTSYRRLAVNGEITFGDKVSFMVPTGNFGDILAGYFAKRMGLYIDRLICASNENRVLTDFFETGTYDRRRELEKTASPSMDILISSNLERLVSLVCGPEKNLVYMKKLSEEGIYSLEKDELESMRETFDGVCAVHEEEAAAIREFFDEYGYLTDPHTAVASASLKKIQPDTPVIILSTASPFKFAGEVLRSLGFIPEDSETDNMDRLASVSGQNVPEGLVRAAFGEEVHKDVIDRENIGEYVLSYLEKPLVSKLTLRVPATSANIGPGFDTLGIAFALYNTFTFELSDENELIGFEEGTAFDECLTVQAFKKTAEKAGCRVPSMKVSLSADVPVSRGLGSSATLYVAGVEAANIMLNLGLTNEEMLAVASELEGHPDNAAPAIFGGMTAALTDDGKVIAEKLGVHEKYRFCVFIPDYRTSTEESRKILPQVYAKIDAVFNLAHVAMVIASMASGEEKHLRLALDDRIHQPYRLPLNKEADRIREIAFECGACGFCLSGSGPTCLAVYTDEAFPEKVREKAAELTCGWQIMALECDRQGACPVNE